MLSKPFDKNEIIVRQKKIYYQHNMLPICPNNTDLGNIKQQNLSNMTETNRIEFVRELTDDLDIEKEVIAFSNYPQQLRNLKTNKTK